jgi:phosphoglycolate phosphatase-like HAD superfamily hydrolase
LLERAAEEHGIDLANSWFVGDKDLDIETGQNAGMSTCLVSTGYGISHKEGLKAEPTIFASDLGEAAVKIASFRKA